MNFYMAYFKWLNDMMTISYQMSNLVITNSINHATGSVLRAEKQEQSASIHRLKITQEAAERLLENNNV